MTQVDWLTQAPYQRHSRTSHRAAESIEGRLGPLQARILSFLKTLHSGATDEEMQESLDMNPSTQRPRRIELQRKGLIVDSGWTRTTRAGRQAVVWKVSERAVTNRGTQS